MVNETNVILAILLSCFAMFVMVMVIIVFVVIQKRKVQERKGRYDMELKSKELQILQTHIETQESEREKIARNIHDDIGPLVTCLKLHLTKFEKMYTLGELTAKDFAEERKFVDDILFRLRNTTHDLSPQFLLRNGLAAAFKSFMYEIEIVEVSFVEELDERIKIPIDVEVNSFRVLTELVNNILRHDSPEKIQVEISVNFEGIRVLISHNGRGIDNDDFVNFVESSNGLGLSSIRARITLLNGTLDFQKCDTPIVIFTVPLKNAKNV